MTKCHQHNNKMIWVDVVNFETLSIQDVVDIHERLTIDALGSDDPISPPGVKSWDMLRSAVDRQKAGYDGFLKYNDPILNAATLCYGICCNHPLHNGNKRTALVSLLCHLDKNGYTFTDRVTQDKLYKFMLNIAGHNFKKKKLNKNHDQSDYEVEEISSWVSKNTRKVEKSERMLSYSDLERLLRNHNIYFENITGNYADLYLYKEETVRAGWFRKSKETRKTKIANIPYWPGRTVGRNLIKSIRKQANLTNEYGIDSALFYGTQKTPDDFIQKYKKVLTMLAKT